MPPPTHRSRGRFAPSPTGDLHIGNARTALLAWLQIRSTGGTFVLRVEDLDPGRSREHFRDRQLEDLRWLGLDWDEGPDVGGSLGPYLQSARRERYEAAIETLRARGLVYPCWCSRKEIAAAASAPHGHEEEGPPYPGFCREGRRGGSNGPAALRFRVPAGAVTFPDRLLGSRSYDPSREVGDFVVRRKDGVPAYQLAVVVDDAAMGITEVLRGSDLLPSTSRQILLYRALRLPEPAWTHVPLLLGPTGERFAKRDRSLMLRSLRERGIGAARLVGWLAYTCGLAEPGEELTAAALMARFDLDRVPIADTPTPLPDWLDPRGPGS